MIAAPAHPSSEGMHGALDWHTFTVGQTVPWPNARGGVAQVVEVLRSNVRLTYPTKKGTHRRALVNGQKLAGLCRQMPVLPFVNLFEQAILPRPASRTFALRPQTRTDNANETDRGGDVPRKLGCEPSTAGDRPPAKEALRGQDRDED